MHYFGTSGALFWHFWYLVSHYHHDQLFYKGKYNVWYIILPVPAKINYYFRSLSDNQEAKEALGWIFNDEITNVFNDDDQNDNNCKRKRENGNNELTAAKKFKLEEHKVSKNLQRKNMF